MVLINDGWRHSRIQYPEESMENLICYCFEYTASDINQDIVTNGRSTIMEKILSEKKAGGCQYATKNPKGR
jgi:hypothetical protein